MTKFRKNERYNSGRFARTEGRMEGRTDTFIGPFLLPLGIKKYQYESIWKYNEETHFHLK